MLGAGFSLGGMVAAQIALAAAADGFTVTHLVVAGSPLGRFALPPEVHALPKVGTFLQPDAEIIARLKPDLVYVHAGPGNVRSHRRERGSPRTSAARRAPKRSRKEICFDRPC